MMRSRILVCAALSIPLLTGARAPQASHEIPRVVAAGDVITSTGTAASLAARETAGPDTFVLYGGPDHPTEGKFQLADGVTADWGDGTGDLLPGNYGGGPGAWTSHDLTDVPTYWHRSAFQGETLGPEGNHVLWCGAGNGDPGEAPTLGWATAPGYGNDWDDVAEFRATMLDPSVGQTVTLEFDVSCDTEPGYDFFVVEYETGFGWMPVLEMDGSHMGTTFSAQAPGVIQYGPDAYGGENSDEIAIRLRFASDYAWSDEDGQWPTDGAVQVDNVSLSYTDGVALHQFSEDFEDEAPESAYLFSPLKPKFAGDFAGVYARMTDTDPCRENSSPVAGFIDHGQTVRNWKNHPEYLVNGDSLSGGSTSDVNYGIPGSFVTNFSGGLSGDVVPLHNEIWSPWIQWDLPTSEDDDPRIAGALFRWTAWAHLGVSDGIFLVWHVRSLVGEPGVDAPGPWRDRNALLQSGARPIWFNFSRDVTDLLEPGADYVQLALGVLDLSTVSGFGGNSAKPSPTLDNVQFAKYRVGGPVLTLRYEDLAQDAFPGNGSIDVSDPDLLDIPFDMARDVSTGYVSLTRGDSVIVDVSSAIPGATVTDIRMVWALRRNPALAFNAAAPSRPKDENFQDLGNGIWTGEVVAAPSTTTGGSIVEGRFFVDLPDEDFLHPGAVLHYFIQATDSDGLTSTLPRDTSGFGAFSQGASPGYDRAFTVRGLPSLADDGSQPGILVLDDVGWRGSEGGWTTAMRELGYTEGTHFDTFTTRGRGGSGSAGFNSVLPGQLAGYNNVFYFNGDDFDQPLSGDLLGKPTEVEVLEDWIADTSRNRNIALFGDYVAHGTSFSTAGASFVMDVLGVDVLGGDARASIGGQTAPVAIPNASALIPPPGTFAGEFVAFGGCRAHRPMLSEEELIILSRFDHIRPLPGAEAGHWFTESGGVSPISDEGAGVASVIHDHGNGLAMTFPYSNSHIYGVIGRAARSSARATLFAEILDLFGAPTGTPPVTPAPQARRSVLSLQPNPFNPSTLVSFSNTFGKTGSVKVYNLRGELVRTLHDGEFTQAEGFSRNWEGTDDNGAVVASGVYVIQAQADGQVESKKAALVK